MRGRVGWSVGSRVGVEVSSPFERVVVARRLTSDRWEKKGDGGEASWSWAYREGKLIRSRIRKGGRERAPQIGSQRPDVIGVRRVGGV